MRKLSWFLMVVGLLAIPAIASAETFSDVPIVDVNCSKKIVDKANTHTRACALKCAASGFAIITSDKKILKLDAAGNTKIVEALKASSKKDHLRVDVSGDVAGDTIKVSSIKLL